MFSRNATAASTLVPERSAGTLTFELSRPVADEAGKVYTEITVEEPSLADFIQADRKSASPAEKGIVIIAIAGHLPIEAVKRMKLPDANRIKRWLERLRDKAAGEGHDEPTDDGRVFELITPIQNGTQTVSRVTLIEPDLGSGVAVEKFKSEHEQTAALIATLSGLTIPVVHQLRLRDIARMEAWFYPFLDDTTSGDPPGG